jgi:ribosomal protein L30E
VVSKIGTFFPSEAKVVRGLKAKSLMVASTFPKDSRQKILGLEMLRN